MYRIWECFKTTFIQFIDKHAPLRRYRVCGKDNPWFNENIANLIRQVDSAWTKAKRCNDPGSWNNYRALRNKCTKLVKAAKSDHYLNILNENLNDPRKVWKLVKSKEGTVETPALPDVLKINQCEIKGKNNIIHAFIDHFTNAATIPSSSI